MSAVAVTDAHALVWYALGPTRRLGRQARAMFARAERGDAAIYVPALVLVEIAEAFRRGVITADGAFAQWVRRLFAGGRFIAADLTTEIVLDAEGLYMIRERGDRLIAATAVHLDCPVITQDAAMARVPHLRTIW